MPKPVAAQADDELLDEALEESFPASDPLSFWSGRDSAGRTHAMADVESEVVPDAPPEFVPDAVPEADDPDTRRGWEASEAMDGPAPTG